jgi:hypothetical protein
LPLLGLGFGLGDGNADAVDDGVGLGLGAAGAWQTGDNFGNRPLAEGQVRRQQQA